MQRRQLIAEASEGGLEPAHFFSASAGGPSHVRRRAAVRTARPGRMIFRFRPPLSSPPEPFREAVSALPTRPPPHEAVSRVFGGACASHQRRNGGARRTPEATSVAFSDWAPHRGREMPFRLRGGRGCCPIASRRWTIWRCGPRPRGCRMFQVRAGPSEILAVPSSQLTWDASTWDASTWGASTTIRPRLSAITLRLAQA
jgi:hypothetical protein